MPKVSIIFPTFNGWQDTKECLKSIFRLKYPQDKLEIIIVDNGSTDGTAKKIKNLKLKVKNNSLKFKIIIIENKKNLGFAKAVNQGIKRATGDYLLITNNDVIFQPNYLTLLLKFLQKNLDVGFVGGKVYDKNSKDKIVFPGARFSFWTGLLRPHKNPNKTSETDWVPGCNMLVRKKVLKKIGLFDEQFFFYFEDLDLCLRARNAGYKVIYYPRAVLWHGEGAAIEREDWQKKSEFYYQGKTRILFKHATKVKLLSSLLFQFLLGLPYQLLVLKHQNYTSALKALFKNLEDESLGAKPNHLGGDFPLSPGNNNRKDPKNFSSNNLPSVTFVFPTLNDKDLIAEVLNSVRNQDYPREKIETIVVDNASSNGTPELIKQNFPWVKLVTLNKNTGSAYPKTLGGKIARGDYILITDDDVIFDRNCLRELVNLILTDPQIGIATGKMLYLEPPHKLAIPGFRLNPYLGYQPFDLSNADKIRECDWAPGACILIKKKILKAVGYFDDQYIFCGDDYDLCFQVRSLGYKIMYTPKAIFYHAFTRAGGTGRPTQENLFAHYRGKFRYALKNSTPIQILTTFLTQITIGPVFTCLFFGNKTFFPIFKALKWNLDHFRQTLEARKRAKKLIKTIKNKNQKK